MNEPLYELTVNFKGLTDEGARGLALWIVSSPETAHMTYWMSKAEAEDEDETEREEQIATAKWLNNGPVPTDSPGEYVNTWQCNNCGKIVTSKTACCPGCEARMEVDTNE